MNQWDSIIDYLKKNDSISTYEAFIHLHITKLPTRIGELEKLGYDFEKTWETKKKDDGTIVNFKRYRLLNGGC